MEKMLAFRLDDIAPGLKRDNLKIIEEIFDEFDIKPIIGVVPQNEDPHLAVDNIDDGFWDDIRRLRDKGWIIAQHGYRHVYSNECGGLLGANPFSEFAGVSYEEQYDMISKGREILESHGLKPQFFMAPGHTFDENTLKALAQNGITNITDGYTQMPYIRDGITFYPCSLSEPAVSKGCDTVCIHLNNWGEYEFENLVKFLSEHKDICVGFDKLMTETKPVDYNKSIKAQEKKYIRKKQRRQKIGKDEKWQRYLQKSYSANKTVKMIKRILYLPTLFPSVVKMAVFLLIFLFLLRSISYVMRTGGESKYRFAGFYAEKRDSIDVLMIGSSTIGTSFCAPYMWENYGFTSYPLSTNSLRPKAITYLIDEGSKYQSPKLIVIEMRTFIADDTEMAADEGHIRETVDNMKYSLNRIRAIEGLTEAFDDKLPFYIDIMKYHSNWGMLFQPKEWMMFNYHKKNEAKGFEFQKRRQLYRTESPTSEMMYTEERIAIPQEQEEVLRKLLQYLNDNGLNALFVASPRADMEGYEAKMNYCSDIITGAGYDFLNLNYRYDEMGFDYRYDLDDAAHTNVWGAMKCSDALGRYICDHYPFEKDYSAATVSDWDKSYKYFENRLSEIENEEE